MRCRGLGGRHLSRAFRCAPNPRKATKDTLLGPLAVSFVALAKGNGLLVRLLARAFLRQGHHGPPQ
jgi:hypothetical protein